MSLAALAIGYLGIGGALALVIAALRRRLAPVDALWLVGLWPLYAPLAFAREPRRAEDALVGDMLAAFARAKGSPLASVLPDVDSVRVLGHRLRQAGARLVEIDGVLARPDFDPAAATARARELTARGVTSAAATAELRIRTIGQLHALRERYRRELDEVGELVAQLVTQAELVRLQPSAAHASSELVRELVARVEGLGDLFAYQSALEAGEAPEYAAGAARCGE
jgi:hypothetical protein